MKDIFRDSLLVAAGGALGTLLRHGLNVWTFAEAFPLGTVIENLTGAFALGLVTGFITTISRAPAWLRAGVGVGFCGGYTTMSTFAADSFLLGIHQHPNLTLFYVAVSLLGGFLFAVTGIVVGKFAGSRRLGGS